MAPGTPTEPAPGESSKGSQPSALTRPTGTIGGAPAGRPTHIRPREDADVRRSLERENETATVLAKLGYRVHQNPTPQQVVDARARTGDVGSQRSRPDYLVEGRVFDCYAPEWPKSVRNIWSEVAAKAEKEQTQRVLLNLQDWGDDVGSIRRQFANWPIDGLKELKAITIDGRVVDIWHG